MITEVFVTLRSIKVQRIIIRRTYNFVSKLLLVLILLFSSYANANDDNDIVDMIMPVISAVSATSPPATTPPEKRRPPQKKTCYCNGLPTFANCFSDFDCTGRCDRGEFSSCF